MSKSRTRRSSGTSSSVEKTTSSSSTVKQAQATTQPDVSDSTDTSAKKTPTATLAAPAAKPATTATPTARQAQEAGNGTKSTSLAGKGLTRDAAKYGRRQADRQQRYLAQRRAKRNKFLVIAAAVLIVVLAGGLTTYFVYSAHHPTASNGTSASTYTEPIYNSSYPPVDNVYCDALEGSVMHIHAHVSIYIDGNAATVPQYVGIPQDSSGNASCFYWLHTHDTSGIIHMESPVVQTFLLGQFLTEWDQEFQSLGFPSQLLLDTGWTSWINGKPYNGSINSIPMTAHALVTIAYNSPKVKPDTVYSWPAGL